MAIQLFTSVLVKSDGYLARRGSANIHYYPEIRVANQGMRKILFTCVVYINILSTFIFLELLLI